MLVAEAWSTSLARPTDAERELGALLEDPSGEPPLRAQAAMRLAEMAMARGDVAMAKRAASRVATIDEPLVVRVARWARRRVIERLAAGVIGVFVVGALATALRRIQRLSRTELRAFAPRAFAICAYLALGAALLANAFEQGNALPFLLVPACLLPILLLARAWALTGSSSRLARTTRATLSAAAVLAVAFLVLDRVDVRYLESFGL